ncbi:dirigent protein 4-like [Tripterygium wilfordii]|uniref:dirigent protein 4-like n=1 Tax=Tripterygium wilfordii TaxID=458696 RepID=UPI0018F80D80|nr:dirigent protein 4-like [Tripterygium wilfordii]
MEGRAMVLLALTLALIVCSNTSLADTEYYSKTRSYTLMKNKVTNLHFYYHDTLSGPNPSSVLVAKPKNTTKPKTAPFGSLYAIDDPLTVDPDPASKVIGSAQGLYVSSSQEDTTTLVTYVDFGFTAGEFNGSSISIVSRNLVENKEREVAVVGGRGKFRMAQGVALLRTYSLNPSTGDAIVEYNVTVVHY